MSGRVRRPFGLVVALLCAAAGAAGCGGDGGSSDESSKPVPAFYLTAASATDLRHQAYDAAAHFATKQGPGEALLMLDFGAARRHRGEWGVALRSGTFFTNDEVHAALQAAADGYRDKHDQGEATLVYITSNANLGDPGHGFTPLSAQMGRQAGEEQAGAIDGLQLDDDLSVAVGGDIEPGYDNVASPEVSIELVAGAVETAGGPYYNVGTAPCRSGRCINGWKPRDVCDVSSGGGREALPEIYFAIQAPGWAEVKKECGIDSFAGVSASPIGDLSPRQSRERLRQETGADVGNPVALWPG